MFASPDRRRHFAVGGDPRQGWGSLRPGVSPALLGVVAAVLSACGPSRPAVVGPLPEAATSAGALERGTALEGPARIDFSWRLNEAGSRVGGVGVARVEPPYRARLDLFLDNGETVVAAALVDNELRLPPGAPDDVLPPVELMWATLGVFHPMDRATMEGGDRLEGDATRLRYRLVGGEALHWEVASGEVRALELLERGSVVQWVRLTRDGVGAYPASATYRNLIDFRELEITRDSVKTAPPFDPAIWDPR